MGKVVSMVSALKGVETKKTQEDVWSRDLSQVKVGDVIIIKNYDALLIGKYRGNYLGTVTRVDAKNNVLEYNLSGTLMRTLNFDDEPTAGFYKFNKPTNFVIETTKGSKFESALGENPVMVRNYEVSNGKLSFYIKDENGHAEQIDLPINEISTITMKGKDGAADKIFDFNKQGF